MPRDLWLHSTDITESLTSCASLPEKPKYRREKLDLVLALCRQCQHVIWQSLKLWTGASHASDPAPVASYPPSSQLRVDLLCTFPALFERQVVHLKDSQPVVPSCELATSSSMRQHVGVSTDFSLVTISLLGRLLCWTARTESPLLPAVFYEWCTCLAAEPCGDMHRKTSKHACLRTHLLVLSLIRRNRILNFFAMTCVKHQPLIKGLLVHFLCQSSFSIPLHVLNSAQNVPQLLSVYQTLLIF